MDTLLDNQCTIRGIGMDNRKDEIIAALSEMVQELQNKLINMRVEAGMKIKEKDREIAELKAVPHIVNGGGEREERVSK